MRKISRLQSLTAFQLVKNKAHLCLPVDFHERNSQKSSTADIATQHSIANPCQGTVKQVYRVRDDADKNKQRKACVESRETQFNE